jgi:hypothetical protein
LGHLGDSCSLRAVNGRYGITGPAQLDMADTVHDADVKEDRAKKAHADWDRSYGARVPDVRRAPCLSEEKSRTAELAASAGELSQYETRALEAGNAQG